ncbi:MAG: class I SAM-dependent methyltransferase [Parachlamydiaceae bacterium]|nr:class I SAM-dependent methyltransferase [Parachlamydiaceae bacterium]
MSSMERQNRPNKPKPPQTSWHSVGKWYNAAVGDDGHYYHKQIILPGVLRLMNLKKHKNASILDLACGQGVLARHLPPELPYTGVDAANSLIKEAKKADHNPLHEYLLNDITKPLTLKSTYSHATIILALQNLEFPANAFKNAHTYLEANGMLVLVLNHPCFRIPRQSSWQIDEAKKIQYRRLDRYASELKIPIQAHPSKQESSPSTWSFHHPLSTYSRWLREEGFYIELIEEWCSDKTSTGSAAKMENRSREEFPLFLTIVARKH